MKKILFVNLMILLIFAGASYWTEVGRGMQKTAAQAVLETQEERSENTDEEEDTEEKEEDYIRWVDFQVSEFAMSEAYEYDRDTVRTRMWDGWTFWHGPRRIQAAISMTTGRF